MAGRTGTPNSGETVTVKVKRLAHHRGLALPRYETVHAAGLDLAAAVPAKKPLSLAPGARMLVPTGLVLELPEGYEAQVRPRSGLALRHGVTVLNTPGTIDSDYRGEVQVLLVNLGSEAFVIHRGDRIAQVVIAPVTQAVLKAVATVAVTKRGAGGFGSTGSKSASPASKAASGKRRKPSRAAKPKHPRG